jgi:hypothetical protein
LSRLWRGDVEVVVEVEEVSVVLPVDVSVDVLFDVLVGGSDDAFVELSGLGEVGSSVEVVVGASVEVSVGSSLVVPVGVVPNESGEESVDVSVVVGVALFPVVCGRLFTKSWAVSVGISVGGSVSVEELVEVSDEVVEVSADESSEF